MIHFVIYFSLFRNSSYLRLPVPICTPVQFHICYMHTSRPINSALAILAKSILNTVAFFALCGLFLWSCARILSLMAACMLFNERSSCRNYRSVELGAGRPTKQAKPLVVVLDPLSLRRSRVSSLYSVHSAARWGQHRCDGKRTTSTSQISSLSHLSPSFLIRFSPVFTPLRVQHDPCFRLMAASTIASQLATTYNFSF